LEFTLQRAYQVQGTALLLQNHWIEPMQCSL